MSSSLTYLRLRSDYLRDLLLLSFVPHFKSVFILRRCLPLDHLLGYPSVQTAPQKSLSRDAYTVQFKRIMYIAATTLCMFVGSLIYTTNGQWPMAWTKEIGRNIWAGQVAVKITMPVLRPPSVELLKDMAVDT